MNKTIKLFACTLISLQIACTQTQIYRTMPPPFSTSENRPLVHEPSNEPFLQTPEPDRKHTPDARRVEPSPAVLALLTAAETNRKQGELESAVVAIERALRIQPRNPLLWHRLAKLRLQQHKPRLALELAKKSNSLAANDRRLIDQNNKLIANARRHQLTAAETNRKQGELESAVVAIERALRIQPWNPLLWHRLAKLRLQQHKPRLALELAKKSNSLAANDCRLIDQNNKLIANARRHQ